MNVQGYSACVQRQYIQNKYTLVSVLQMGMLSYNPHSSISKMLLSGLALPVAPLPQMKTEFWLYNYKLVDSFRSSL